LTVNTFRGQGTSPIAQSSPRPGPDAGIADADAKIGASRRYLTQRIAVEALVSGLQDDDEACRFRFVGPQCRKGRITPTGKANDFLGSNFRFQLFGRLQDVKAAVIDKERMNPKHAMQLRNRRMIDCREEPQPRIGSRFFSPVSNSAS
jgi:hypothetical protein